MRTVQGTLTLCKCLLGLLGEERYPDRGNVACTLAGLGCSGERSHCCGVSLLGTKPKTVPFFLALVCPSGAGEQESVPRGREHAGSKPQLTQICAWLCRAVITALLGTEESAQDWLCVLGIRNKTFFSVPQFPHSHNPLSHLDFQDTSGFQ